MIGSGAKLEINVVGDREFARELFGLSRRALEVKPAFDEVLEILREGVRGQYRTNGFRGNTPWKPLSPAYKAEKIRRGLDPRIMLAEHDLYDSLAGKSKDSIAIATDDELAFGSKRKSKAGKPILPYHQSRRPRSKIPRRPVVALTGEDRDEIVEVFRDHIVAARRAAL